MTPTYIHKLNLGVKMSYNMRHALKTMFCLLSVSCLVSECFCLHTTVMLTVCYINRQQGREGITIPSQMLAARAPQAKRLMLPFHF